MQPKVIFLDWYRTLSDSLFWQTWQDDPARSEDLKAIQSAMFRDNSRLVNEWMRGKLGAEQAVEEICRAAKLDPSLVFEELIASSKTMRLNDDTVLESIENLRNAGAAVLIATDNMDTFTRWTAPSLHLADYFDGIIDSHSVRALKGDFEGNKSLFFDSFLSQTKAKPEEMVLIDDREDAAQVERAGIKFCHFKRTVPLSSVLDGLLV